MNSLGNIKNPWPKVNRSLIDEILIHDVNEYNDNSIIFDASSLKANYMNIAKNKNTIEYIFSKVKSKVNSNGEEVSKDDENSEEVRHRFLVSKYQAKINKLTMLKITGFPVGVVYI